MDGIHMLVEYKNETDASVIENIEYEPCIDSEGKVIAVNIFFDGLRLQLGKKQLWALHRICITQFDTIIEPEKWTGLF